MSKRLIVEFFNLGFLTMVKIEYDELSVCKVK